MTMNEQKKLSKKLNLQLYIGSTISLINSIILFFWSIIVFTFEIQNLNNSLIFQNSFINQDSGYWYFLYSIFFIIKIIFLIIILIMCIKILKRKTKTALSCAVLTLAFAGVCLITWICFKEFVWWSIMINLITLGLEITAGVLLVLGNYIEENTFINNIEKNSIVNQ